MSRRGKRVASIRGSKECGGTKRWTVEWSILRGFNLNKIACWRSCLKSSRCFVSDLPPDKVMHSSGRKKLFFFVTCGDYGGWISNIHSCLDDMLCYDMLCYAMLCMYTGYYVL